MIIRLSNNDLHIGNFTFHHIVKSVTNLFRLVFRICCLYRHRTRTRDEEDDYEYDHRGGSYDRPRNRKHPENKRHSDDDRRYDDSEERRPQTDGNIRFGSQCVNFDDFSI